MAEIAVGFVGTRSTKGNVWRDRDIVDDLIDLLVEKGWYASGGDIIVQQPDFRERAFQQSYTFFDCGKNGKNQHVNWCVQRVVLNKNPSFSWREVRVSGEWKVDKLMLHRTFDVGQKRCSDRRETFLKQHPSADR